MAMHCCRRPTIRHKRPRLFSLGIGRGGAAVEKPKVGGRPKVTRILGFTRSAKALHGAMVMGNWLGAHLLLSRRLCLLCAWWTLLGCLPVEAQQLGTGLASYYAEVPDRSEKLTAAHRTLPFGTMVNVTRVDSGAHVVVRINDRGPFITGRVIDLSVPAAEQLAMTVAGVTRVAIQVIPAPVRAIKPVRAVPVPVRAIRPMRDRETALGCTGCRLSPILE